MLLTHKTLMMFIQYIHRTIRTGTSNFKKNSEERSPGEMILCQYCGLTSVRQKQSGLGV